MVAPKTKRDKDNMACKDVPLSMHKRKRVKSFVCEEVGRMHKAGAFFNFFLINRTMMWPIGQDVKISLVYFKLHVPPHFCLSWKLESDTPPLSRNKLSLEELINQLFLFLLTNLYVCVYIRQVLVARKRGLRQVLSSLRRTSYVASNILREMPIPHASS